MVAVGDSRNSLTHGPSAGRDVGAVDRGEEPAETGSGQQEQAILEALDAASQEAAGKGNEPRAGVLPAAEIYSGREAP
ncbi:MAG: hypothetical protein ACT4QF_04230 [Sporichthyaceae bacterium]